MPDQERLLSAINAAEETALGRDDDQLTADRADAIDRYYGRPYGDEREGRSKVVDRSVADTIEWIMPSLVRIFTGTDELCRFEPKEPGDEAGARQESDYVNHIILNKNNWFETFYTWAKDGLLTRNAYVLGYWSEDESTEKETYQGLVQEHLAMLEQDPAVEIVQASQDPYTQTWEVAVQRKKGYGCVKIVNLPPERCLIDNNSRSPRVRDGNFFQYWDEVPISTLRDMGYDVPDDISDDKGTLSDDVDLARDHGNTTWDRDSERDPSMRRVRASWNWIRHDYDEDGYAELIHCVKVGSTLISEISEAASIPVASWVPVPMPHRHVGVSIYDQVQDVQRIKTVLMRNGLDAAYLQTQPRSAISRRVNLDDYLTSRVGGVVRIDTDAPDVAGHVVPLVQPDTSKSAMALIEYMDQVRENRTGTNRYFTGVDANALNKTATGVQQLTASAAQRVELIARVMAEGVKELFSVTHELTQRHGQQAEIVRLRGEWVPVDPRQWKTRTDISLAVGVSVGSRQERMAHLTTILQFQEKAMVGGLPIVDPSRVFNAASELIKEMGFPAPEKFLVDPAQIPPQPPQPDPNMIKVQQDGQLAQAEMQMKAQAQEREFALKERELMQKEQIAAVELQLKQQTEQEKLAFQRDNAAQQAEIAKQPKSTVQISGAGEFQQAIESVAQLVAQVAQQQAAMEERFQGLAQMMSAPKQIIRGPDGKAVGVAPVGAQ